MWLTVFFVALGAMLWMAFRNTISLNWQILIGAGFGLAFGFALRTSFGVDAGEQEAAFAMRITGRIFIAALKMIIVPMIFLAIVVGIASLSRASELGRTGGRTVLFYVGTMVAAIAVGLVAVNVFEPGNGGTLMGSEFFRQSVDPEAAAQSQDLGAFLLKTVFQVLSNPFQSLSDGGILPIVAFAILFGIAVLRIGSRGDGLVAALDGAYAAVMVIIGWFMRFAPAGVMGLLSHLTASIHYTSAGASDVWGEILLFFAVVWGATLFHAFVTLPIVARVFAGLRPARLFGAIRDAMLVAFTTSSSAATLPVTTRCVEDGLGVPQRVSSFVLPLGATVNMDGTALYEAIAAIFVANIYGIDLGLGAQLVVFLVAMAAATGAPGIPSAGMVTLIVVLESVGLPAEAVGILLPFDRLLDTVRTMANVEGDCVVAACVARGVASTPA